MIKLETVGMFNHIKNDPTVKAHAELANGAVFTIADGKTVYPTADTAKGAELWIAMNTFGGDERYTDAKIPAYDYVNAYLLKEFDHQNLIIDADNLNGTPAAGKKLVANTAGQFLVTDTITGYAVYLEVLEVITFGGKTAVRAKVVVA